MAGFTVKARCNSAQIKYLQHETLIMLSNQIPDAK